MAERNLRRVGREQVHMVLLPVELGQGRPEVRAHLRDDLFTPVEHLRVEHARAVLGGEHQVDVQIMDDAATTPVGVWFPQGRRRSSLRCVP